MFKLQLSAILLLVYSFSRVSGYAPHYMLTNSQDCVNTPLTLGYSPVMASGGAVVLDTSGRKTTAVITSSSGVSLSSGSTCGAGETLTIGVTSFTSSTGSLVMEARGTFIILDCIHIFTEEFYHVYFFHVDLGGAKFVGGTDCTAGAPNSRVAATPS